MIRQNWLLVLLLLVTSVVGCSRFQYEEDVSIDKELFGSQPPRSLAVVPFTNATDVANANEIARQQVYAQLTPLTYKDVELSRINAVLSDLALQYQLEPDEIPPPLIRRAGLADAILTGSVEGVSKRWAFIYSHIRVALELKLIDTRTNEIIYRNTAIGRNYRFTAPTSLIEALTGAWSTITHLRDREINETLEELAESIAESFPDPAYTRQGDLYIRDAELKIPNNPMKPGDVLSLEFYGTPSRRALVDIGTVQTNLVVPEIEPGKYNLRYRIPPGTQVDFAIVRLRLRQEPGKQVEVSLYDQPFSIRSAPAQP